jgi:phosphatidylglycerol lysyltransferase
MLSLSLKFYFMGDFMFYFYLLIILILLIWNLNKKIKSTERPQEADAANLPEVWKFTQKYGGNHTSHLNFLNDKQFYWAQNKQVLISYQKVGKTLVVLGDPIGKEQFFSQSIVEFEKYCRSIGKTTVLYQVSPPYINDYQKRGYRVMKLGEEAKLYLLGFSLEGKKGAKLRTRKNKFERNGYYFEVLFPNHPSHTIEELKKISDSWLGSRKEKGFSVGFFCPNYITRFPLALLYNTEGKVIAFATLASNYQENNRTITIDLMRYHKDSPHGTMDYLFLSIFNWCKEQEYEWCSMGMSPLANLNGKSFQTKFDRIGQFIFHKGNHFYNFKGLYEYKNKFQPSWESRYLVYRRSFLPVLIFQLIWLVNRNPQKTTFKIQPHNIVSRMLKKAG